MAGKSPVAVDEGQRGALRALAHSRDRGEADRARAVLLTLSGWTSRRITVEWLPKYAPELNDIEVVWHDLKAHHLAHQTFPDTEALDRAIHAGVAALNRERSVDPLASQRISA